MTLEQIEQLARQYATRRQVLTDRVCACRDELESVKRRKLPGIKSAVSDAKDAQLQLRAAIDEQRDLFARPKSRVFHGIKVGLQKAKGKLRIDDEAAVIALIHKHFAERFPALVKTTNKPIKKALAALPAADLKKLGCTIVETGDEVLAEPVDSEIDKLVGALLDDKHEQQTEED